MESLPLIRLEIDEMKHVIMHHFTLHQQQVSKAVAAEIERVVGSYDYESAVTKAATEVLDDAIKSFFKCGEVQAMIQDAMSSTFEALENALKGKR